MAQVVFEGIGQAVGGASGAAIGGLIGRGVDQAIIAGLEAPRQRGPRLDGLKLQGTSEGAPMAFVLGRARVVGQVIWAARFQEDRQTRSGSKGGPRTVGYGYSLSFAVALCEGEIDGVGRIWADGQAMDLSGTTCRVHRGDEGQAPDPLIEAIEGAAPAYRGTAYVVFEDLPLGPFGNRVPQLGFEVFRRARGLTPRLEDRVEGVCLIPGAGEFVLATDVVLRREGLTRTAPENLHGGGRSDLALSLDLLQAQLPNLKRVSLVIGWFGDDLRASRCKIRPGVERDEKSTEPLIWSVAGLTRSQAHLISRTAAGPAYGGTPCDDSVRQAVAELKARGLEVTLYPFVFMDIPADSGLPDPDGEGEQAPYPWRGRLKGRDGEAAAGDVDAVFGEADGWGLRRLALHYAGLASETGAAGLLIGSEMRGLTATRDADGGFPAVTAFRALAAECRALAGPNLKLSYAADWSEYAGTRDDGEVRFHLDPLWADPAIDYVGIDWYAPLGDWREGDGGSDALDFTASDDLAYLASQVAGGEGFDWFYANPADRAGQVRTPITDALAAEDWVFRGKDLAGWWGSFHHERSDGLRHPVPTAWIPGMKPIRFTEFGCAAIDRGGNAPNVFLDPKSAESALPPFSSGERNDRMQRRALEAVLEHFTNNNPISAVYGAPMLEAADVWCWDARPWPAFPARTEVWADADAWRCGHWLNGRLEGETGDLITALLSRGGVEQVDIDAVHGEVQGYVLDRPMAVRDGLRPLLAALGLTVVERNGALSIIGGGTIATTLVAADMALPDDGVSLRAERRLEPGPTTARVRFIDGARDYQTGSVLARTGGEGGGLDIDLPVVCGPALAGAAALRALGGDSQDRLVVTLGPLDALRLEPGDDVAVEGREGLWRLTSVDLAETASATLEPSPPEFVPAGEDDLEAPTVGAVVGSPFFRMLELPPLPGAEDDDRPFAVVAADPWSPTQVRAGVVAEVLTIRAEIQHSATVGALIQAVGAGPRHRLDRTNALTVRVEGQAPQSRVQQAVLAGGNTVAVETAEGWELVQFARAELVGDDVWRLSDLLRAQQGTERAMRAGAGIGAVVVFLDQPLERATLSRSERGLPLVWRAGSAGLPGGAAVTDVLFTAAGVHDRPWSPVHLRAQRQADGAISLRWIPRSRLEGDRWEGEDRSSDPLRFRVRVLAGEFVLRTSEVAATDAVYPAEQIDADFPDGLFAGAVIEIAQWGEGYGWGESAALAL